MHAYFRFVHTKIFVKTKNICKMDNSMFGDRFFIILGYVIYVLAASVFILGRKCMYTARRRPRRFSTAWNTACVFTVKTDIALFF